jgi:hypothetical protein
VNGAPRSRSARLIGTGAGLTQTGFARNPINFD